MCGGCAPATGINSPPEGGVHGPPARFACAVPAAPRALPGRGLAPPDPQGCAPWRAFAHRAPAASVIQPEGFRARVRRWRGWATACGCPCPTPSPSPSPLDSVFQKQGNRSVGKPQACPPEGVSPCSGGGGQTSGPPARAAVHLGWAARLSTAKAGHRAQFSRSKCQPAAGAQVLEKIIEGLLF